MSSALIASSLCISKNLSIRLSIPSLMAVWILTLSRATIESACWIMML
uniref:Uncharacterized protein n=1 Tax=Arundo donax TaxID=35708 RepID=A0A0A9GLF5_ARUDO